jgi:hypothetical protein
MYKKKKKNLTFQFDVVVEFLVTTLLDIPLFVPSDISHQSLLRRSHVCNIRPHGLFAANIAQLPHGEEVLERNAWEVWNKKGQSKDRFGGKE